MSSSLLAEATKNQIEKARIIDRLLVKKIKITGRLLAWALLWICVLIFLYGLLVLSGTPLGFALAFGGGVIAWECGVLIKRIERVPASIEREYELILKRVERLTRPKEEFQSTALWQEYLASIEQLSKSKEEFESKTLWQQYVNSFCKNAQICSDIVLGWTAKKSRERCE